jgi:hypothetical protein
MSLRARARTPALQPVRRPALQQQRLNLERIDMIETERRSMQNIVRRLRPAQIEIRQAAHDQDLVEVPRRAQLDRENDGAALALPELVRVDEAEG